jgi:hypothetical protein
MPGWGWFATGVAAGLVGCVGWFYWCFRDLYR